MPNSDEKEDATDRLESKDVTREPERTQGDAGNTIVKDEPSRKVPRSKFDRMRKKFEKDKQKQEKEAETERTEFSVRRKKKKENKESGPAEESIRARLKVPESDADGSVRRKKQKKKKEQEEASDFAQPSSSDAKQGSKKDNNDGSQKTVRAKKKKAPAVVPDEPPSAPVEPKTARERKHKKKHRDEELKSMHYLVEETSEEKKLKDDQTNICTENYGYGSELPNWMLEVPRTITHCIKPGTKVPICKVMKNLIVYEVPPELRDHIDIGDIICKFNNKDVTTREDYTTELFDAMGQEPAAISLTFYRTVRCRRIPLDKLDMTVPACFELLTDCFDYLNAYIVFVPKTRVGMNIKTYNGKVFVSAIDNGMAGLARKSLLVGDAILAIDDHIVSGVKSAEEILSQASANKKFVKLLVERAKTKSGVKQVKLALSTEKTVEINPRMGEDILDLCNAEIRNMTAAQNSSKSLHSIYVAKQRKKHRGNHLTVADESTEVPISTDVNNVGLLASTPPVASAKPLKDWDGRGGYVQGTPEQIRQVKDAREAMDASAKDKKTMRQGSRSKGKKAETAK